jgi:succinate dehydrogenase/fumarate reductase cytochrome b subunit
MIVRGRLATLGGVVLFAYLVVWMAELAVIRSSPSTFDQMQQWSASLAGRLVACAVVLAAVHHALDGIRAALTDAPERLPAMVGAEPVEAVGSPGVDHDAEPGSAFTSAVIAFTTWLLVLPCWALLLRPWIEDLVG